MAQNMKKKTTIQDIASKAQVSASAVTLALNGKPGVSDSTRNHIVGIAKELGYIRQIDKQDRNINRNIHYVVDRVHFRVSETYVPHFHNLFMEAIQQSCYENNCFLILHYYSGNSEDHDRLINIITKEKDPMVLLQADSISSDTLYRWQATVRQLVALNNDFLDETVNLVTFDFRSGIEEAFRYLIERGHRKIGRLRGIPQLNSSITRDFNIRRCFEKYGLNICCDVKIQDRGPGLSGIDEAYEHMKLYIQERRELPSVFIVESDKQALGAIRALMDAGKRIPNDVAILSFNDAPMAVNAPIPVTTIRMDWTYMAQTAIWLLLNQQFGPGKNCIKIQITTQLIVRESA